MPGVAVSILGRADAGLGALAVSGDLLAMCGGRRVSIRSGVSGGRLVPGASWEEPGDVGELALAPSGRFLLLRSAAGDAIEVRRTDGGASVMRLEAVPGRPFAAGAIAATPDGELLVASVEHKRLEVRRLDTAEVLHDELVELPRGFFYRHLVPMLDGDSVVAIGYYAGEGKDTLVVISLRRLLTEAGYLPRAVRPVPLIDDAYRLAAGPCGPSAAVIYRDPEDGEDPEEDDEELDELVDPNRLDVHGVHGLYVRRLSDLAVAETIASDVDLPTGTTLAGTGKHVVAATEGGALVVPRSGGAATLVPAARVAVDARAGRCVLAAADGELRLLVLP